MSDFWKFWENTRRVPSRAGRSVPAKLIAVGCLAASAAFGQNPVLAGHARGTLLELPLSFESNRGQTNPAVKFISRGDGYALFLTEDSAVFKLGAFGPSAVVGMKLLGANPAQISGAETLPGKVNYFIGTTLRIGAAVSQHSAKSITKIYKGVDLVYYGKQGQLEYDFIVAAGADPKQIVLEFTGAKPKLGPEGDLVLTLHGAPLRFRKPAVYQLNAKMGGRKDVDLWQLRVDRRPRAIHAGQIRP